MSKPRNPNPPIRTQLVKNKKAQDSVWYVIERKVQYNHEKNTNNVLESHCIGILKNKEDDYKDMIPIDEWNEQQKQKKQEKRKLAKEKKRIVTPTINDTRTSDRIIYKPHHLFVFMMLAWAAGYTNCHGAATFLNSRMDALKKFFDDFKDIELSNDCLYRFLLLLSDDCNEGLLEEFNQMLIDEAQDCDEGERARTVLAVDGQAVRATKVEAGNPRPRYVLSVYDNGSELILAQEIVGDKTNEITHIEGLLQKVNILGKIVTADALHATVRFVNAVLNGGGHYLIKIKNNNPVLKEWIKGLFEAKHLEELHLEDKERDYGHGRIEKRSIRVLPGSLLSPELKKKWKCTEEGTIAELTSVRYDKTTDKSSTEVSYLVSSLPYTENNIAKTLLSANRSRWGIETTHWLLDIVYSQDRIQCKNERFFKGITLFNKIVLNFVRVAKKKEEKRRGKKISQESFKGIISNIEDFFRLYMDIIKIPNMVEA